MGLCGTGLFPDTFSVAMLLNLLYILVASFPDLDGTTVKHQCYKNLETKVKFKIG